MMNRLWPQAPKGQDAGRLATQGGSFRGGADYEACRTVARVALRMKSERPHDLVGIGDFAGAPKQRRRKGAVNRLRGFF